MTIAALAFAAQLAAASLAAPPPAAPVAVEVIVYSDFQCPFCARFAGPFRELQTKGVDGQTLEIEFKHFPLSIHPGRP